MRGRGALSGQAQWPQSGGGVWRCGVAKRSRLASYRAESAVGSAADCSREDGKSPGTAGLPRSAKAGGDVGKMQPRQGGMQAFRMGRCLQAQPAGAMGERPGQALGLACHGSGDIDQ